MTVAGIVFVYTVSWSIFFCFGSPGTSLYPLSVTTGKSNVLQAHQISSRDIKVVICYYSETRVSVLRLYSRQWCTKISNSWSIWGCMTIMRSRRSHRRQDKPCPPGLKTTGYLKVMTTPRSHRSRPHCLRISIFHVLPAE